MPRKFVSEDALTKKLRRALEAEGLDDLDFGPVRKMREIGLAGENWWVNVIKNASPEGRCAAEDIIREHQERYSVD